ncbi:hypothetical protein VTK56DRAFT_6600 [Thermocarpiscus australiensis]
MRQGATWNAASHFSPRRLPSWALHCIRQNLPKSNRPVIPGRLPVAGHTIGRRADTHLIFRGSTRGSAWPEPSTALSPHEQWVVICELSGCDTISNWKLPLRFYCLVLNLLSVRVNSICSRLQVSPTMCRSRNAATHARRECAGTAETQPLGYRACLK